MRMVSGCMNTYITCSITVFLHIATMINILEFLIFLYLFRSICFYFQSLSTQRPFKILQFKNSVSAQWMTERQVCLRYSCVVVSCVKVFWTLFRCVFSGVPIWSSNPRWMKVPGLNKAIFISLFPLGFWTFGQYRMNW